MVDDVGGIHAVGPEDPLDLGEGLAGREVPRHADSAERVTDDEVQASRLHPLDAEPSVLDAHLEVRSDLQPESFHVDVDDARVDLRHGAPRARSRLGEVARQGQAAAAEMVRLDRLPGGEARVDGRGQRPDVAELQVGRVLDVDVGVPQVVQDQAATGVPVRGPTPTTAQWYAVSASHPLGATPAPSPPTARTTPARCPRDGAEPTSTRTPAPARRMPRPTMIQVTGTREMRTKPVRTVPRMAPVVPMPESRPTTDPVSARLASRSFVTIGVTADSSSPDDDRRSSGEEEERAAGGRARTAEHERGGRHDGARVPRRGPSMPRESRSSAHRPPIQDPPAIAASARPMTRVLVSRVRPR